jgi:hypothetical protein
MDIYVGWPGSTHDNRVFRNSKIYLNHINFFDNKQYLLGDSAYCPSPIVIPAFKKSANQRMPVSKQYFNTKLAHIRIKAEHCIGVLKGRYTGF